jgi:hypothetical protein
VVEDGREEPIFSPQVRIGGVGFKDGGEHGAAARAKKMFDVFVASAAKKISPINVSPEPSPREQCGGGGDEAGATLVVGDEEDRARVCDLAKQIDNGGRVIIFEAAHGFINADQGGGAQSDAQDREHASVQRRHFEEIVMELIAEGRELEVREAIAKKIILISDRELRAQWVEIEEMIAEP